MTEDQQPYQELREDKGNASEALLSIPKQTLLASVLCASHQLPAHTVKVNKQQIKGFQMCGKERKREKKGEEKKKDKRKKKRGKRKQQSVLKKDKGKQCRTPEFKPSKPEEPKD